MTPRIDSGVGDAGRQAVALPLGEWDVVVRLRGERGIDRSVRALLEAAQPGGCGSPLDRVLAMPELVGARPLLADARAVATRRAIWWILPDDDVGLDRDAAVMNVATFATPQAASEAARVLSQDERVAFAHHVTRTPMCPGGAVVADPHEPRQWALAMCGFPSAWAVLGARQPPSIAVVDSGLELWHRDAPAVSRLSLFGLSAEDATGHGTAVAGIAAAPRNAIGMAGASPCKVEVYKVFAPEFIQGYYHEALYALATSDAKVISLSIGHLGEDPIETMFIRKCMDSGKIVVACMGNAESFGQAARVYPGAIPSVIAVGATNRYDELASYSIHGDHIWLCAPGSELYTCVPGGGYGYVTGTSFATPLVAAACSLLCALSPDGEIRQAEARELLRRACVPISGQAGWTRRHGHGRLDLSRALSV